MTPFDPDEMEIDLSALALHLLRKAKYIAATALVGLLIAAIYVSLLATPIYEATAQLYVVNSKDNVLNLSDLQIGSYLAEDYQLVFNTWEVNQQVIENMNLPYTVKELTEMLTVTNPSSTRALFITVSSPNAQEAAEIANEYANVARQYISSTMLTDIPTILSTALTPLEPVRPNKLVGLMLGFFAGLVLSTALFVVLFLMDNKVKTSSDILQDTGVMPLSVIPVIKRSSSRRTKGRS